MSIISFVKSKTFRNHLLLAFALIIVMLWLSLKALDVYTRHGRTITVPDLSGMPTEEAKSTLNRMNLRYTINDSIFDSQAEKGTVASQNPEKYTEVKRNRTVYLTTVAILPEMTTMPDLTDLSLRQALALLQTYGLKAGNLEYVPSIARNAVLQQKFNQGTIEPGTTIEKGTAIDLVLGTGEAGTSVIVPMVVGRTREEAIQLINSASLNLGDEVFLDDETEQARVYRQSPNAMYSTHRVPMGSKVDLYYRSEKNFDFEEYEEQTLFVNNPDLINKSPQEVLQMMESSFLILGNEVYDPNISEANARVYRQDPDPTHEPRLLRGTEINVWYHDKEDASDSQH